MASLKEIKFFKFPIWLLLLNVANGNSLVLFKLLTFQNQYFLGSDNAEWSIP